MLYFLNFLGHIFKLLLVNHLSLLFDVLLFWFKNRFFWCSPLQSLILDGLLDFIHERKPVFIMSKFPTQNLKGTSLATSDFSSDLLFDAELQIITLVVHLYTVVNFCVTGHSVWIIALTFRQSPFFESGIVLKTLEQSVSLEYFRLTAHCHKLSVI